MYSTVHQQLNKHMHATRVRRVSNVHVARMRTVNHDQRLRYYCAPTCTCTWLVNAHGYTLGSTLYLHWLYEAYTRVLYVTGL